MKLSLRSQFMILILMLFPAQGLFAASNTHKGDLTISEPVQVQGKQLAAGDYTVQWDGAGPTTQVNIIRNHKVVATVPAKVVTLNQKADQNAAEVTRTDNGSTLTRIDFGGKEYALDVSGSAGGAGAQPGDTMK